MTTPPRALRTEAEIAAAGERDEHALGPPSPEFAEKLAAAVLPALMELHRRRQEHGRDGVA